MLNMTLFGRVLQITQCDSRQCTKPTLSPRTGIPILGQGNLPRDQLLNTKPKPRGSRVPESTRSRWSRARTPSAESQRRRIAGGPRRRERTRPSPRERGEGGGGKLGKGRARSCASRLRQPCCSAACGFGSAASGCCFESLFLP